MVIEAKILHTEPHNAWWYSQTPLNRDTHYFGQFALSLGKENPYIFSKWTLSMAPLLSVLTRFDCNFSGVSITALN